MSCLHNSTVFFKCKQYTCKILETREDFSELRMEVRSEQKAEQVFCPFCGRKVETHQVLTETIKELPFVPRTPIYLDIEKHQYICTSCHRTHTEKVPFKEEGTRLTKRLANWIRGLLVCRVPVSSISKLLGVHWDTIRFIQKKYITESLEKHTKSLKESGYKPKMLAVDEFAIHRGHKYATSVMDLDTGEILWVGHGRGLTDFSAFFAEYDMDYLSDVVAVAMDMNASFNRLFSEKMPWAEIVYDRFHMQAQFGREVLGSVRLEEARKHKENAKQLTEEMHTVSSENRQSMKDAIRVEKTHYRAVKRSRWSVLRSKDNLSEKAERNLQAILDSHENLAVCYAMKEEVNELFSLRNTEEASRRWLAWFEAAKSSGIPALVSFASHKESRIPGLIAHAKYPISTGKLEGLNNKIKVAKRDAYGYRDEDYFFSLIRFLSLPSIRAHT